MQVKWTAPALKRLEAATNYGRRKVGELTAARFYQKVRNHESLLVTNPRIGKIEQLMTSKYAYEYRSLVVHPHYKLIYYINEAKGIVVITNLFDVRRESQALKQYSPLK